MGVLRGVLCAGAVALIALAGNAWGQTPANEPAAGLQVVGPEGLKLSVDAGKEETEPVTVWVRNATDSPVHPRFSAQLQDTDTTPGDVVSVLPASGGAFRPVPAKTVQHYRLRLKGLDDDNSSEGQLVISADAPESSRASVPAPATVGVTVTPKRSYGNTYYYILFVPALLAMALVAIGWRRTTPRPAFAGTIAPANLSFSSGFASTLTIVGAVLGTVIAAGVLPTDTMHLAVGAYKALNIIFGALIAAAVLIVSAFQKQTAGKDGGPELRAYVWAFLIACAVTAWAAFGELATLWFLIWDVNGTSGLTDAGVLVLDVLIAVAGLAMVVYVVRRIGQVVGKPAAPPTQAAETPAVSRWNLDALRLPRRGELAWEVFVEPRADRASVATPREGEGSEERRPEVVMVAPQAPARPPPRFVL
jgi:hypothetical protein